MPLTILRPEMPPASEGVCEKENHENASPEGVEMQINPLFYEDDAARQCA